MKINVIIVLKHRIYLVLIFLEVESENCRLTMCKIYAVSYSILKLEFAKQKPSLESEQVSTLCQSNCPHAANMLLMLDGVAKELNIKVCAHLLCCETSPLRRLSSIVATLVHY